MSEKRNEPAWSDQAESVYVATIASIDEIDNYNIRMNLLLNLVRYCTMTEAAVAIQRALNIDHALVYVEARVLESTMRQLVDEFASEISKMPRRMIAVMHAENGCGGCSACNEAKREAYGDGKAVWRPSKESREAIDAIINTITGGKPRNPDN